MRGENTIGHPLPETPFMAWKLTRSSVCAQVMSLERVWISRRDLKQIKICERDLETGTIQEANRNIPPFSNTCSRAGLQDGKGTIYELQGHHICTRAWVPGPHSAEAATSSR